MFYKLITGDRFFTAVIIFLLAVIIWTPGFLSPETLIIEGKGGDMPFYVFVAKLLNGDLFWSRFLALGFVILEGVMLVRMNARYILVQQRTFLPALFFIILSSHSPELMQWNPVLPATFFLILVLEILFRSYKDEPNSYRYFDAGILLGLGCLFYAPLVYLLPFIWIAGIVQRPFYWRELLFPVLGFMVPVVFLVSGIFFLGKSIPEFWHLLLTNFIFEFYIPHIHWIYIAFASYVAVLIMLSSVFLLKVFQFRKIYIRDYFMVLFWMFIASAFLYFLLSGFNNRIAYITAVPISYILTNYFTNARRNLGNKILLYLLFGFALFLALNNFTGWV